MSVRPEFPTGSDETEIMGFLLCPGYPLLPVAAAIDVLALANYVSGKPLYTWYSVASCSDPIVGMNSLRMAPDFSMEDVPPISSVVVCCGVNGHLQATGSILNWLRKRSMQGVRIGALSTGSWVLAEAGLLAGRRCTIHWEDLASFKEIYPDYEVTSELFETDGPVFTCSGGTAVVDLFLTFVAAKHGIGLANEVAEQVLHSSIRTPSVAPHANHAARLGVTHHAVRQAIDLMEQHLEIPLSQKRIADGVGLSERQLERLFKQYLNSTPQLFYRQCRLLRAQSLLRQTSLSIFEIAMACGFSTSSYFAKCYGGHFGRLPAEDRSGNDRTFQN